MTEDIATQVLARLAAGGSFSTIGQALGLTKGQVAGVCHREKRRLARIAAMPKPAPGPQPVPVARPKRPLAPSPPPIVTAPPAGCQWPYGDPKDRRTFRFCGQPVAAPGASYCHACYRKAYTRRAA